MLLANCACVNCGQTKWATLQFSKVNALRLKTNKQTNKNKWFLFVQIIHVKLILFYTKIYDIGHLMTLDICRK